MAGTSGRCVHPYRSVPARFAHLNIQRKFRQSHCLLLQRVCDIASDIEAKEVKNVNLGKIMHLFFDRLTFDDSFELEKIEQEISNLEEELIVSKKNDFVFLVSFRKRLLTLKVYYEQLLEIYEAIELNENGLIDQKELRQFKTQTDINLNSVMKVFTVITSIFFLLMLIVGWIWHGSACA